jgi:hypothetical protein
MACSPFLKGNTKHTIGIEIAAIDDKQPQNRITEPYAYHTCFFALGGLDSIFASLK